MRIAFFGTPDFAVPSLEALLDSGEEVVCVVTQPDKPKGRGMGSVASAVKVVAEGRKIPVLQPASVRTPPFAPVLAGFSPDLAVVVAYGKILPRDLLAVPRHGFINVHGSILPRWRGAAPIQWAVLAGDEVSGVTTMQLDEGMDTGDILLVREVTLAPDETAGSLFARLAPAGASLLVETIARLQEGRLRGMKQDGSKATHARMLEKEDGRIDWSEAAVAIDRRVRGTSPWPGAWTMAGGRPLKIHRVRPLAGSETGRGAPPGAIAGRTADGIEVRAGDGTVVLLEVQPDSGKRMSAAEFARGRGAAMERFE